VYSYVFTPKGYEKDLDYLLRIRDKKGEQKTRNLRAKEAGAEQGDRIRKLKRVPTSRQQDLVEKEDQAYSVPTYKDKEIIVYLVGKVKRAVSEWGWIGQESAKVSSCCTQSQTDTR